jgi:hypothetical protein
MLCSGREIVNQNRGPSGNLLPKLRAANRATGALFVKPIYRVTTAQDARCTDGKIQAGRCSVLRLALFQEHSGLTTSCDDGFSEPEYFDRLPAWWRAELVRTGDPVPLLEAFWRRG